MARPATSTAPIATTITEAKTRPRRGQAGWYLAAVNLTSWFTIWSREDGNAQRSDAGWVTARDTLHGRAVDRRRGVEMAPPYILDSAVNGRDPVAGGRPPP